MNEIIIPVYKPPEIVIAKGTTPTLTFTIPVDLDLTTADVIYVTFSKNDNDTCLEKTGNDLVVAEKSVSVFLTQEETFAFPEPNITVTLNFVIVQGGRRKRFVTDPIMIKIKKNAKKEVI